MLSVRDLIRAVLKRTGPLSTKKLVKILYLVELEYIKTTGKRLTNIKYIKYKYGPYAQEIINIARADPYIVKSKIATSAGHEATIFELSEKYKEPPDLIKEKFLENFIDAFSRISKLHNKDSGIYLESMSKETEPYKRAKKMRETLDLMSVNSSKKGKIKFLKLLKKKKERIKPLSKYEQDLLTKDTEEAIRLSEEALFSGDF